jgi:AraC-like DNA-binding protein
MQRASITEEELAGDDNRIDFVKCRALMQAAKRFCSDPAFALHFGEAFELSEISILGQVQGAKTFAEGGLAQMNRYGRLDADLMEGERFAVDHIAGELWVIDRRPDPNAFAEFTEAAFARMVCTIRRMAPDMPIVRKVHFTHAEPPYRAEYERIFQVPLMFDSECNALVLNGVAWTAPVPPRGSTYVAGVMTAHAEAMLKKLESTTTIRGSVEAFLLPILHKREANIDTIAAKLGYSRQTLFRRLKAEGTTFAKLLDGLRREMAMHYLDDKTINETAYLLGFSDPAAFSRAFKRWTGSSPRRMLASKG